MESPDRTAPSTAACPIWRSHMERLVTSRWLAGSFFIGSACLGCGDEFETAPDDQGAAGPPGPGAGGASSTGTGAGGASTSTGGGGSGAGGSGGGPTGGGGGGCEPGLA